MTEQAKTAGDYDPTTLAARARASREAMKPYVDAMLREHARRAAVRARFGVPVLAFLGYGRAGKDESAKMFAAHVRRQLSLRGRAEGEIPFSYGGSCSSVVAPVLAHSVGLTPDEAYAERHRHRQFWLDWCHAFRDPDLTLIVRMLLGEGDVVVGLRGEGEFAACVRDRVFDLSVWVERPGVERDFTVEFRREDCDIVLSNDGSLSDLDRKVGRLAAVLVK